MKNRSITIKLMLLLTITGLVFSLVPNSIISNYLLNKYDVEVHMKNQELLNTVVSNFQGELLAVKSAVDAYAFVAAERFLDEGGFKIPDLKREEDYYEALFGAYLRSESARSTSAYIHFDPILDDEASFDVWMHKNGGVVVREAKYVWNVTNPESEAAWFYGPKEKGHGYWVDPYRNRFNEHITSYVTPLYVEERFIGIIGMYLELEDIKAEFEDLSYYDGDVFWIYNREGEIIYHPSHDEGEVVSEFAMEHTGISDDFMTMDGISYYTYKVTLPEGWTFLYSIPTGSLSKARNNTITMIVLIFIITFTVLSMYIFAIGNRYRSIFSEIIEALGKIKQGERNHRLKKRTNDEIGLMVEAINESNESLVEALEDKYKLAYKSRVTGLPNRNKLIDDLQKYYRDSLETKGLSLVYVDLDQFQSINDLLGYSKGDDFIRMISKELKKHAEMNMTFYHTRIDEFVYLIEEDLNDDVLHVFAGDILRGFGRNINFVNHRFYVTLGIGIVRRNASMLTIEDLFRAADIALDQTKKKGRNQLSIYNSAMYEQLLAINEMERDFANALIKDEFTLHYQPKVNMFTGQVDAMEALVRWVHPKKGMVYPGAFIEFAEKSGLIIALGDVVLSKACRQINTWKDKGEPDRIISVNISLRQVMENDFVESITRIVEEYSIEPGLVELEITESMFIGDSRNSISKISTLKSYGFRIAMDDFGSGYSSLSSVNAMPLDTLKVDRSLIQNCTSSRKSIILLETIIDMAKRLELDVVAEGVEDKEQKELVESLGCKYIQGYYYAKPLAPDMFTKFCQDLKNN